MPPPQIVSVDRRRAVPVAPVMPSQSRNPLELILAQQRLAEERAARERQETLPLILSLLNQQNLERQLEFKGEEGEKEREFLRQQAEFQGQFQERQLELQESQQEAAAALDRRLADMQTEQNQFQREIADRQLTSQERFEALQSLHSLVKGQELEIEDAATSSVFPIQRQQQSLIEDREIGFNNAAGRLRDALARNASKGTFASFFADNEFMGEIEAITAQAARESPAKRLGMLEGIRSFMQTGSGAGPEVDAYIRDRISRMVPIDEIQRLESVVRSEEDRLRDQALRVQQQARNTARNLRSTARETAGQLNLPKTPGPVEIGPLERVGEFGSALDRFDLPALNEIASQSTEGPLLPASDFVGPPAPSGSGESRQPRVRKVQAQAKVTPAQIPNRPQLDALESVLPLAGESLAPRPGESEEEFLRRLFGNGGP